MIANLRVHYLRLILIFSLVQLGICSSNYCFA